MPHILEGLNDEQKQAVTETEGFVRVIAGAGSGKTRALSHRFAYLVEEIGVLPGNILCVTFTNKSAGEMRRRIHQLTGDNDTGYINTFHGFCVSVLQEDSHAVQYPKNFLVLDNADIDSMLKIIYEERNLTLRNMTYSKARDMIEIRKNKTQPDYYLDMIAMSQEELFKKYQEATDPSDIIFYGYLYQEKKCFGLDYNDLILFSLYIFDQNEDIRLKWQKRLEYIMIDEFQDIDELQYRLMEVLCGYHKNLFVVGDPDQTIYTWRGANVRYLLDFDQAFPPTKTIMMMKNYRSTPQILAAANALIGQNKVRIRKELLPILPDGETVVWHHAKTAEKEAEWIARQIQVLSEKGVSPKDITILYRAHYITRNLEEIFLREKIPYTIYSGVQFFGRAEIKDALSYLRMVVYRDDLSFLRIANLPKRNLGKRRMQFLQEYAAENRCSLYESLCRNLEHDLLKGTKAAAFVSLIETFSESAAHAQCSELLSALLNKSGYERMLRTEGSQERLDNLAELKQSVYEYEISCGEESTPEDYLRHVALFTNSDADGSGEKVRLMTVHTAKGLEFPYVFLGGMSEGMFPAKKTDTMQAMEEERRLAFVALTRAEKSLMISDAEGRNFDGSFRYPSRFIFDIGDQNLCCDQKPADSLIAEAKEQIVWNNRCMAAAERLPEFSPGDRIRHSVFGVGTITGTDPEKSAYLIQFDGLSTPRTSTFRAKLQKEP